MIQTIKFILFLFLSSIGFVACAGNDLSTDDELNPGDLSSPSYLPGVVYIYTQDGAEIKGKQKKDYVICTITINHQLDAYNYSGTGKIRGRGNTTWNWFPKKPYRIKLDAAAELLGLPADKDWVLLANFRDPTDMMNAFAFEVGRLTSLSFNNNNRFVDLYFNDQYIGLYQLTEQIEVDDNRVNINPDEGILLSMDVDDGPEKSPDAGDNFISKQYNIPICIKNPENLDLDVVATIQQEFYQLEKTILNKEFKAFSQMACIESFADFILVQELTCNVDLRRPASLYIHRDKNAKWTMGPLWDFDSGYDFDWSEIKSGHDYFISDNNLILGINPAQLKGITEKTWLFTHLFAMPEFVKVYKQRWSVLKDKIMTVAWNKTYAYATAMMSELHTDAEHWQINKNPEHEINKMKQWLDKRVALMTKTIENLK